MGEWDRRKEGSITQCPARGRGEERDNSKRQDGNFWNCAQMQCCVPHLGLSEKLSKKHVFLCPIYLTSFNSNNVFPLINVLWIREILSIHSHSQIVNAGNHS